MGNQLTAEAVVEGKTKNVTALFAMVSAVLLDFSLIHTFTVASNRIFTKLGLEE